MNHKFELGDANERYLGDPAKAISTIAMEYANATDGNGQGFLETLEFTTDAFTPALNPAQTPDARAAFRAFADALLAAHQEPQPGTQGENV